MKRVVALMAVVLLAAAAPRDWSRTITATPAGGVAVGNPAARVHLVEYGSLTCPHCGHFAEQSKASLARYIASGSTQVEFRNMINDQVDLAAAIVAHCGGAARFPAIASTLFAQQQQWLPRAFDFSNANQARFALYPPMARLKALADGGGITAIGIAAGTPAGALDRCFADQTLADRLTATAAAATSVTQTPTFFINGRQTPPADWAKLDPLLRAAGAR